IRFVLGGQLAGTYITVASYYMIAATFLPLAFVEKVHGHIMIELFTYRLPPRTIAAIDFIVHFFCSIELGFCGYAIVFKSLSMTKAAEYAIGSITLIVWPSRWFIVAGAFVFAAYMFLRSSIDFQVARGKFVQPPSSIEPDARGE